MTMTNLIFDDAYTGDRYTYGLTHRPLALAHVPDGWIIGSDREHKDFPVFGTVQYPRPLTPASATATTWCRWRCGTPSMSGRSRSPSPSTRATTGWRSRRTTTCRSLAREWSSA